jgi:PhoPQ-activated pathogenicity-related protein
MRLTLFHLAAIAAFLLCPPWSPAAETPPDALARYVARPEPAFGYELVETQSIDSGTAAEYRLTSQTWKDIVWRHALMVYEPREIEHPRHMLLFVTGGRNGRRPGPDDRLMGMALAHHCGARVAVLHQTPNQPLLGDRVEDDLITETWLKYLQTGDDAWPLLFPMVKSAVKAMDALQEISREKWETPIESFVITGASKRGWTSWLTPAADKRVIATAPMVIDTLNFPAQMQHQLTVWGEFSEQIADYTSKGLVREDGIPRGDREVALWKMMDPYSYRSQLKLPKLLICGTNDRYWVVDAMQHYWDDLEGSKRILFVPNSGHSLKEGRDLVISTIGAFFRHAASGRQLPEPKWTFAQSDGKLQLNMECGQQPVAALLWTASADGRDFRESTWSSRPLHGAEGAWSAEVERRPHGHQALFGELRFIEDGLEYAVTTRVYTTIEAEPVVRPE